MRITPNDNDVLLGRGYAIMSHPGNEQLRSLVADRRAQFLATPRSKKRAIAYAIVNAIHSSGGRFLEEDKGTKSAFFLEDKDWREVEREKAVEKVMHRLREKDRSGPKLTSQTSEMSEESGGKDDGNAEPSPDGLVASVPDSAPYNDRAVQRQSSLESSTSNVTGSGGDAKSSGERVSSTGDLSTTGSSSVPVARTINEQTAKPAPDPRLSTVHENSKRSVGGGIPTAGAYQQEAPRPNPFEAQQNGASVSQPGPHLAAQGLLSGGAYASAAPSPNTMPWSPTHGGTCGDVDKIPTGGLYTAKNGSVYFLLESKHVDDFPLSLETFVRSGKWSHGIVSMQGVGTPEGSADPIENATRLALLVTQLYATFHTEMASKSMLERLALRDFAVTVERRDVGAGPIHGLGETSAWALLRIDAIAATGEGPKRQGSDASVALPTLGRLLYSVFTRGEAFPPHLLTNGKAPSPDMALLQLGEGEASLGRKSKSPKPTENSLFSKLVEGGQFPVSICRLLSDLMDKASETPVESVEDVVEDLTRMISQPRIFLHDSDPRVGLSPLLFGQTTYGRTEEMATIARIAHQMMQSIHRPDCGNANSVVEAVFVSGRAGSGKSRLVQAVGETLSRSGWIIIKAKFERDLEYVSRRIVSSMFDQAVSYLVRLKESGNPSDAAASLRASEAIATSIGYDRLSLLVDFLPSLPRLFDGVRFNANLEMQAEDAQWRLIYSLSKIIEAILDTDRFIMICCDDLQWADKSTLALISEVLVNIGSLRHSGRCLYTGLYRDNEINDNHPFTGQYAYLQMMTANVNTTKISVSSLSKGDIAEMLMMELRLTSRFVKELADIVHKRTSGHAFFVAELLNSLLRDSVIAYSSEKCRYDWDQVSIHLIETGKSVAELIASNISSMPAASQWILRILSCFGIQTDLSLLHLLDGFQEGIITAVDAFVEQGILDRAGPIFMFAHDLIQQQVYESMSMSERQRLHLSLGQFLGERAGVSVASSQLNQVTRGLDEHQVDDRTFHTGGNSMTSSLIAISCDQINAAGPDLVTDGSQRVRFATWNLAAGRQAYRQTNSRAASLYFSNGIALLGKDCWQEHSSSLCLDLHEGVVVASFALGEYDDVAAFAEKVSQNVPFEDALEVQRVLLLSLTHSGKHHESVAKGLDILRQLNFDVPSEPSPESLMKAVATADGMASKFSKEQLLHLCEKTVDDSVHRVVKVMDTFYTSCYASSSPFLPVVACIIIQFSLQNGICIESSVAFATLAMLKIFLMGDYAGGRYWADMVLEIEATHRRLDQSNLNRESFSRIILFLAVDIWFQQPRDISQKLLTYHHNSMRSGQLHIAVPAMGVSSRYLLLGGENLSLVKQTYEHEFKFVAKHSDFVAKYMAVDSLLLTALTGEPGDHFSAFDGSMNNMKDIQENAKAVKDMTLLQSSHVFNVLIEFWKGNYLAAEEHSQLASVLFPASKEPTIYLIYHILVRGLIMFRLHRTLGDGERLKNGKEAMEQMEKWAGVSTKVFENKSLLLKAEYHATVGEFDQALQMYEGSIRAAKDCGLVHEMALAYELFGNYRSGCSEDANECYGKAYNGYMQWGATAVANKLMREHNLTGVATNGLQTQNAKRSR